MVYYEIKLFDNFSVIKYFHKNWEIYEPWNNDKKKVVRKVQDSFFRTSEYLTILHNFASAMHLCMALKHTSHEALKFFFHV